MKNNQGISLIELVVVMIIMILLIGFAIFNGYDSVEKAEATEIYSEMTNMKRAISGVIVQRDLESGDADWLKDYYDEKLGIDSDWYKIYGEKEDGYKTSSVRKKLNMDTIKRTYLVNYETGDVNLEKAVKVLGSSVRTYDSVRALVESDKI